MRYLITFSYDGTKFHGFQRQNNVRNVQGELEHVLSSVLEENILIKGSGRTDAGVHATCQCAHFDTEKKIGKEDLKLINKMLNHDIFIKKIKVVNDDFHARHDVKEKTYIYKINNGKYNQEMQGYYYQVKYKLDLKLMRRACKLFIGTHDFRNFVSGPRIDYISTIFKVKLKRKKDIIFLEFTGIGFYRYMVRHLVGAILDVGRGKASLHLIENMLDNPTTVKSLSVVPADGLYLWDIKY